MEAVEFMLQPELDVFISFGEVLIRNQGPEEFEDVNDKSQSADLLRPWPLSPIVRRHEILQFLVNIGKNDLQAEKHNF